MGAFRNYLYEQALPLVLGGMNTGYLDPSTLSASPELATMSPTARQGGAAGNGLGKSGGNGGARGQEGEATSHVMLNAKDPQSIAVVGEAAVLLHAVVGAHGREEVAGYLQQALPVFGWGPQAVQVSIMMYVYLEL